MIFWYLKTKDKIKYWTALYFTSNDPLLPEKLAKVLIDSKEKGVWYTDFKKTKHSIYCF